MVSGAPGSGVLFSAVMRIAFHNVVSQRSDLNAARTSSENSSALDEGEQVRIDHVGVRRAHAVRELLVDLEGAVLQQLRRQRRRVGYGHDLVVVAMHDQG